MSYRLMRSAVVFFAGVIPLCSLAACAVSVGGHGDMGIAPEPAIDMMKPINEDFYGSVSSFGGRWEGDCNYNRPSGMSSNSCWTTVTMNQSPLAIAGTVTYVIDGRSGSFYLPQYQIDGNSVRDALGRYSGRIGIRALSVSGDTFGELSLRRMFDGKLGLLVTTLPEDRSTSYSPGYRLSGSLHRTY